MPRKSEEQVRIVVVRTGTTMQEALSIRRTVFIAEQGVREEEEIDGFDGDPGKVADAVHVVAYAGGLPAATGRVLFNTSPDESAHIGRVAVLREYRRQGLGTAVMLALHDEALRRGYRSATVAAQVQAIPFYESIGYVAFGDVFLDARIEHRMMERRL